MAGVSRRAPFPYDIRIAGVGYMLGQAQPPGGGRPSQERSVELSRPQDLTSVVPTDFGPSALNPTFERVQIYDDMAEGMGQRLQSASRVRGYRWLIGADQRYYYALGADWSCARQGVMGPAITSLTPATTDATNGVSNLFEIAGGLYALVGRYCLKRTDDTAWAVSKDFGAGKTALDVCVFYSNGASANLAYVAMGDSDAIYKFDGTTWTQSAEALYARAFAVVGREFWRAAASTANTVVKCDTDADPFVLANWSAPNAFTVGDKQNPITRLVCTPQSILLIFKADGVYTLDSGGWDENLFPAARSATDTDNGRFVTTWLDSTYVSYRDGAFRLDGALGREEIGTEKLTDNASVVRGRLTAMQGHDTFCLYAGLYNDDTSNSHLMKFGGWDSPQDGPATRVDAWHGSLSQTFTSKKITAMYRATTSNHGADSGHSRMLLGFSDGSLAWFQLPCTPNPAACSNYKFSTTDAYTYLPTATMGFPSDPKMVKSWEVGGPVLNSGSYAYVQYRTDSTGAFSTFVDSSGATQKFQTGPMQRIDAPSGLAGNFIDQAIVFHNATSSTTPIVNFFGIHYTDRTALRLLADLYVLASNTTLRRDGSPYRLAPKIVRDNFKTLASATVDAAAVLPDESSVTLVVVGYQETMVWSDRTKQWHGGLKLQLAEGTSWSVPDPAGSYAHLEKYTYDQLSAKSYGELETLV